MSQLVFDDDMSRRLEALYRTRDIRRRRGLVHAALAAAPGERILDVGCGPGYFAAELLDRVGSAGAVVGLDASPQMLALAERRCAGRDNARFERADATSLPVEEASFDAALTVQVLEYVADATAALAAIHRALRPGGRLVVWDIDWATVSWHSVDPIRMQRVLRAWDAHLAHPSLPRTLGPRLRSVGFTDVDFAGHVFATAELTPDAFGAGILPLIEQFVAEGGQVEPGDVRAWAAEQRGLGERGEFFFACVQFCFTARRAA